MKPSIVRVAENEGVIRTAREHAIEAADPGATEEKIDSIAKIFTIKREADSADFLRGRELLESARLIRLSGSSFAISRRESSSDSIPVSDTTR